MKKFLVYGIIVAGIIGIGISFNDWEYKGEVKAKEYKEPKEQITNRFIESDGPEMEITLQEGEKLILDMQNAKINLKCYEGDSVLISDLEGTTVIRNEENGKSISEHLDAKQNKTFDYITIKIPKKANFDLEIKTNNSNIFGTIDEINNINIESNKGIVDLNIGQTNNINVETGIGNIGLRVKNITGEITGRTGIGSINFDIENEENVKLKGYKVYEDKVVKVNEINKGNVKVDIKGDLAKVIFN
ncbi:MAG: hypothetical protein ACRCWG_05690 [Sarcina sp.]